MLETTIFVLSGSRVETALMSNDNVSTFRAIQSPRGDWGLSRANYLFQLSLASHLQFKIVLHV